MGKLQSDLEFLRTRAVTAIAGVKCLGEDHLLMVDRLARKDGSGRELGAAAHRRLAMELAAGSTVIRCALLAQHLLPEVDWVGLFTATPDAPPPAREDGTDGPPATDPRDGNAR